MELLWSLKQGEVKPQFCLYHTTVLGTRKECFWFFCNLVKMLCLYYNNNVKLLQHNTKFKGPLKLENAITRLHTLPHQSTCLFCTSWDVSSSSNEQEAGSSSGTLHRHDHPSVYLCLFWRLSAGEQHHYSNKSCILCHL